MNEKEPLVVEWGKMILLTITLLAAFGLVFVALLVMPPGDERIAGTLATATGLIGTVIGYVTGNGRLISRGQAPIAVIARKPPELEELK